MENKANNNMVSIRISSDDLYRRILILMYKHKELQLSELSKEIGMEISDLTPAVSVLENKGFIHQLNLTETNEKRKISLREGRNCIIGLDLGGTKLYGAISDIAGNIIYDLEIKNHGKSGEECFDMLVDMIDRLIDKSNHRELKLLGIGIDVPGQVQLETGLVVNAPAVNMKDFPLKERLLSRFGYPMYIDNDLKQASLGEAWFGAGKNYPNMVLLAIGTGIAACTVIDGNPLRGAHLRQGELGWMVPGRDFLGRKYVGFGALETEASGPGIVNRARKLINVSKYAMPPEELKSESVFEAARRGETWAEQCVAETVDYLAILIANIMAFYDPAIIILSGGVSRSSDMLIPSIMKLVEGCVLTQPYLVVSSLGYKAGVLGAIINLIQYCPEFIR
jgi:glucokinase